MNSRKSLPAGFTVAVITALAMLVPPSGFAEQQYTIAIHPGFNLIANQLNKPGGNTLNNIMPAVSPECVLYKWDNAGGTCAGRWIVSPHHPQLGWIAGDTLTLNPGEGAFLQSSVGFNLTFRGEPNTPILPLTLDAGCCYLLSRQTNGVGTFENIMGISPSGGERVFTYNGGYTSYVFDDFDLVWVPSTPVVAVGEAMWICSGAGGFNPPPGGLVCPTNKTVPCDTNWTFDLPAITGSCGGSNITIIVLSTVTNAAPCPWVITRTWQLIDLCSNILYCAQTVTVMDSVGPILTCAPNKTVECNSAWAFDPPTAWDVCCGTNVTVWLASSNLVSGTPPCHAVWQGVWQAVDCCTNFSTCTQTVTVVDTRAPLVFTFCITNVIAVGNTNDDFATPETAFPSAGLVARLQALGGSGIMKGFDICSNNTYCAHTFSNLPACIVSAHLQVRTKPCPEADNCQTDTLGLHFTDPAGNPLGVSWERYLGADPATRPTVPGLLTNNWCSYTNGHVFDLDLAALPLVSGEVNLLPDLRQRGFLDFVLQDDSTVDYVVLTYTCCECSTNKTVECGTPWTFDPPSAWDECCGNSVSYLLVSSNSTVLDSCRTLWAGVWQITDCCTNSTYCTQMVTVVDTAAPVFTYCPTNLTVECGTPWDFGWPTAWDVCCGNNVTVTPFSTTTNGRCPWIITRLWQALDCCTNVSTCTQTVTVVVSNTACVPLVSRLGLTNITVWESTSGGESYLFKVTPLSEALLPIPGGPTEMNWDFYTGANEYYDVFLSAPDGTPDTNGCCVTILCYMTEARTNYHSGNNIDAVELDFANGSRMGASSLGRIQLGAGITDPALIASAGLATNALGLHDGNVTRLGYSNSAITLCFPQNCFTAKTVECGLAWTFDEPGAVSECCPPLSVVVLNTVTNGDECAQVITRTWEVTDCCTNRTTCSQTVTVLDTQAPILTCAGDKTVLAGAAWSFDWPSAWDVCCDTNVTITSLLFTTNGNCCTQFIAQVWLAVDCCTNYSTCTQTVTVVDLTAPVITVCPPDQTLWAYAPDCVTNLPDLRGELAATDNCPPLTISQTPMGPVGVGTHAVVFTVLDACGNWAACTNFVTVQCTNPCVIQSYTVTISNCCTLIANQLDKPGGNTLDNIMPDLPVNCRFMKYDNTSLAWITTRYSTVSGWENGTITLNPGEGAFLCPCTDTNFDLTFTGCPHTTVITNTIPDGFAYLLSRQTNAVGNYENTVGTAPPEGAMIWKWNPILCAYEPYFYDSGLGGWLDNDGNPVELTVAIGEAVWISPSSAVPPPRPEIPCLCVTPPDGLSAWWPFDETAGALATDIAGLVNNLGVHVNGPTPVAGMVGNALCFDGLNDYVLVTNQAEINFLGDCASGAESFTIDAWIRPAASTVPSVQPLLDKRSSEDGWQGYSLYLWNGRLGIQIATGPGGDVNHSSTAPDLRDDQWHFIAVTVWRCATNRNVGTLYVDGTVVWNFVDLQTGDMNNSANLLIGRHATANTYYSGCIDELEIIKRVLSPAEIQGIYEAGAAGKCKGTLCGTKFNDLNRDGQRQGSEPGLGGWVIQAVVGGVTVATTITDTNGNYCFTNLPGGWTVISEVQQPAWVQTAPAAGSHYFTNRPGLILGGLDFGNRSTNCCEPPWNPSACCTNCTEPYLLANTVTVQHGTNLLVNPFCHGNSNTVGVLLPNVWDGTTLIKWNPAIQAYGPPIMFVSEFGWVDQEGNDASGTPLPPGDGFVLMNPVMPYSVTFIGCEPDVACKRCRPTNVWELVGAMGASPSYASWTNLFRCPPDCGTQVRIWNGTDYDGYTNLNSGWIPSEPFWPAGTAVFVSVQPDPRCCDAFSISCGAVTNGIVVTNETGRCDAVVSYPPPAVSGGCPPITTNCVPPSGSRFPVGITTVVCTASDSVGQTVQCSFPVTVLDLEPPVIQCATNFQIECGNPWQFTAPTAWDNCTNNIPVTVVSTSTNGTCPWIARRIWRATDAAANTSTCTQTVTVVDTTAPIIVCGTNRTVICGTNWDFDLPQFSDACCPSNTLTVVALDSVVTNSDHCVTVFTRTWQVTDCCTNTATCSQSVTVIREIPAPVVISCQLDTNGFHLTFATETCVRYVVESKDDLTVPAWTTLTEVDGDGLPHEVVDGPLHQMRFYRIRAVCQTGRFHPPAWP
jgi:hypothetical protein